MAPSTEHVSLSIKVETNVAPDGDELLEECRVCNGEGEVEWQSGDYILCVECDGDGYYEHAC